MVKQSDRKGLPVCLCLYMTSSPDRKSRVRDPVPQPHVLELQPVGRGLRAEPEEVPVPAGLPLPGPLGPQGRDRPGLQAGRRGGEAFSRPGSNTMNCSGLKHFSVFDCILCGAIEPTVGRAKIVDLKNSFHARTPSQPPGLVMEWPRNKRRGLHLSRVFRLFQYIRRAQWSVKNDF